MSSCVRETAGERQMNNIGIIIITIDTIIIIITEEHYKKVVRLPSFLVTFCFPPSSFFSFFLKLIRLVRICSSR